MRATKKLEFLKIIGPSFCDNSKSVERGKLPKKTLLFVAVLYSFFAGSSFFLSSPSP